MDTSNSPAFAPVCNELKTRFAAPAAEAMPTDLTRLLEALDDAYSRGDLFNPAKSTIVSGKPILAHRA
jgi:hypothetical protein